MATLHKVVHLLQPHANFKLLADPLHVATSLSYITNAAAPIAATAPNTLTPFLATPPVTGTIGDVAAAAALLVTNPLEEAPVPDAIGTNPEEIPVW